MTDMTALITGASRGIGRAIALELAGPGMRLALIYRGNQHAAEDTAAACREKGLLVLTAKTRLRLLPPLTVSEHEVDMALEVLAEVLGTMEPTAPKEQA